MRIGVASERGTQCQQRKARDDLGLAGTWMALAQACQGHGAHGPSAPATSCARCTEDIDGQAITCCRSASRVVSADSMAEGSSTWITGRSYNARGFDQRLGEPPGRPTGARGYGDVEQPRASDGRRLSAASRRNLSHPSRLSKSQQENGCLQETDVTNRNGQFSVVNPRQLPPSRPPRQALWHAAREPKLAVDRRHAGVTFVLQSSARIE
jgi:hypothetical protein